MRRDSARNPIVTQQCMRIAVTGAASLLGQALIRKLEARHLIVPLTRADADITDLDAVCAAIAAFQPDLVIHTAAARGLDWCKTHPEAAKTIRHSRRYDHAATRGERNEK